MFATAFVHASTPVVCLYAHQGSRLLFAKATPEKDEINYDACECICFCSRLVLPIFWGTDDNRVDDFCCQDLFSFELDEHSSHSLSVRRYVQTDRKILRRSKFSCGK